MAGCCSPKALAWGFAGTTGLVNLAYLGMSLYTFIALSESDLADGLAGNVVAPLRNSLLAACLMSFVVVAAFLVYSALVLLWRRFGEEDRQVAYGVMLGMAIHTSWFLILSGLTLQNRQDYLEAFAEWGFGNWSKEQYQVYQATYVFAYALSGFYILKFFFLLFLRHQLNSSGAPPGRVTAVVQVTAYDSTGGKASTYAPSHGL